MRTPPLLPLLVLLLLTLTGCTVDVEDLEFRHGKAYRKGSASTYSGYVHAHYPTRPGEKPRLYQEGEYDMGLKSGTWITHAWNGQREEAEYRLGKRHGDSVWYDSQERRIRREQYQDGVLHGMVTLWDADGKVVSAANYEQGRRISSPAPEDKTFGSRMKEFFEDFSTDFGMPR